MVKHKTAQQLMATRNPLARTAVTPVDIYVQAPQPLEEPEERQEPTSTAAAMEPAQAQIPETPPPTSVKDRIRPYSTYLRQSQVKGIKLRAIEREMDDKDIVQEAIDEYFENHPL